MLTDSPASSCPRCASPIADSRAGVRERDGQIRELLARRYTCGALLSWCSVAGPTKHADCSPKSEVSRVAV